jgi:RNA polymerase sigma-70 factor (ECF subfamily)
MPSRSPHANDLVARIQAGDRTACDQFVRAHYEAVYRFLLHLTSSPDMAADFTQDTFQVAWQKLADFRGRASLASWLHRIAYNKFVDSYRRLRRDRTVQENLKLEASRNGAAAGCAVVAADTSQHLYAAVQQLPDEQRTIVILHYFEGLSLRETADVVDEALGTVKWRLSVALGALRSMLKTESVI